MRARAATHGLLVEILVAYHASFEKILEILETGI
jgi:hypothetical protein